MLKYAEYKKVAYKKDSIQQVQIKTQDSIIKALKKVNDTYRINIVPNLEHQVSLYEQKEVSNKELWAIKDEKWQLKYNKLKSKKIGVGFSAGYGVTPLGLQPTLSISLNYNLFRL